MLNYIIATVCLLGLLHGPVQCREPHPLCSERQWALFKRQYGKRYAGQNEETFRKSVFCQRLSWLHKINWSNLTYKVAMDADFDRQRSELLAGLANFPRNFASEETMQFMDDPPEQLNWALDSRVVGPVKRQGQCGACWAFALTGLLEGQQHRWSRGQDPLVPLSEQQLIDCSSDEFSCEGGWPMEAAPYIRSIGGLQSEQSYPYKSNETLQKEKCKHNRSLVVESTRKFRSFFQLRKGDEQELMRRVANQGPVLVCVQVHDAFIYYKEGILLDPECNSEEVKLDHCLLLVGYGSESLMGASVDYWILKNSWGSERGEQGYWRLVRNRNNHCGIASYAVIAKQVQPLL